MTKLEQIRAKQAALKKQELELIAAEKKKSAKLIDKAKAKVWQVVVNHQKVIDYVIAQSTEEDAKIIRAALEANQAITGKMPAKAEPTPAPEQKIAPAPQKEAETGPLCPICGAGMIQKFNVGGKFWRCVKFHDGCKGTRNA